MVPTPWPTDPPPRHALAALCLAALVATAGCSSVPGIDLGPDCPLHHYVAEEPRAADGVSVPTYSYANLSENARLVFDRTLADNGSYMTNDESLDSPEFRYTDEVARYNVSYGGETVQFRTRSGHGCTIDE